MDSTELFMVDFTKQLFAEINDYEVEYVVLAGLDNFPSKIGRDIDLYLPYDQLEKIISLTKKLFTSSEWISIFFTVIITRTHWPNRHLCYFFMACTTINQIISHKSV